MFQAMAAGGGKGGDGADGDKKGDGGDMAEAL